VAVWSKAALLGWTVCGLAQSTNVPPVLALHPLENMSHFIAYSGSAYIIGGGFLLIGGLFLVRRDYAGHLAGGKPLAH